MTEFKLVKRDCGFIENIGLHNGHVYAVAFNAIFAIRCGYVLLNDTDRFPLEKYDDLVHAHGHLTLLENDASHIFETGDIKNQRIIGWDYNHVNDGGDFEVAKEFAKLHNDMPLLESINNLEKSELVIGRKRHVYTSDEVSEDCKKVIDELVEYQKQYDESFK